MKKILEHIMTREKKIEYVLKKRLSESAFAIYELYDKTVIYPEVLENRKVELDVILDWDNEIIVKGFTDETSCKTIVQKGDKSKEQIENIHKMILNLRSFLDNQSNSQIDELYGSEIDEDALFRQSEATVDLDFWRKMPSWSPEEAAAIALGKNPKKVNVKSMRPMKSRGSLVAKKFFSNLSVLRRMMKDSDGTIKVRTPNEYIKIMKKIGILPNEIFSFKDNLSADKLDSEKPLHHLTREVFYQTLLGFAIICYGLDKDYTPKSKSGPFQHMAHDLAELGLSVDEKTLRDNAKDALAWARSKGLRPTMTKGVEHAVAMRRDVRQSRVRSGDTEQ